MKTRAFSLVEVVITLAVLGMLGTFAAVSMGGLSERSARQKLVSDVDTLNRAVGAYLAMGGSLAEVKSPAEVIVRLKSTVSAENATLTPGLASSFVDPRLAVVLSADQIGVVWDAGRRRLVLDGFGVGAVRAFTLDDSLAEIAAPVESRQRVLSYAKESSWIWDYEDRSVSHGPGATEFVVALPGDDSGAGLPEATTVTQPTWTLAPPRFSRSGGLYDFREFDLPISLTNPNPGNSSKLVYAVDYGEWRDYTGPVSVAPGSVLSAQVVASGDRWGDSAKADQRYEAEPVALTTPVIQPSHDSFGMFHHREVEVALFNPNPDEHSRLEYRVGGTGDWLPYELPFVLSRENFSAGADIEARAVSVGSPYYQPSPVTTRSIPVTPFEAGGGTSGVFANAGGSSRMVTSLDQSGPGETFAWGELLPTGNAGRTDQSRLAFQGSEFAGIGPDEAFEIGVLSYFNGTILSNTGADRVDLTIQLDLSINGVVFRPDFTFSFDLVNTVNTGDAWASADFVRIVDPVASQSLVVNDYEYQFQIEFGLTTSAGYAVFDEFHVLEGADAAAQLFGTLVEIGRVSR